MVPDEHSVAYVSERWEFRRKTVNPDKTVKLEKTRVNQYSKVLLTNLSASAIGRVSLQIQKKL